MLCFFFILIGAMLALNWWERNGEDMLRRLEITRLAKASVKRARQRRRSDRWNKVWRLKICNR